jgi:hypothetical protein
MTRRVMDPLNGNQVDPLNGNQVDPLIGNRVDPLIGNRVDPISGNSAFLPITFTITHLFLAPKATNSHFVKSSIKFL